MSLTFFKIGTIQDELVEMLKYYLLQVHKQGNNVSLIEHESVQLTMKDYAKLKKIPAETIMGLVRGSVTLQDFADATGFDENAPEKTMLIEYIGSVSRIWKRVAGGDKMCLQANKEWLASNKPYFNIYPDYAKMFTKTRLDVPCDSFVFPYTVFDVLFSNEHPLKVGNLYVKGFRIYEPSGEIKELIAREQDVDTEESRVIIIRPQFSLDPGETALVKKGQTTLVLGTEKTSTVEQSLNNAIRSMDEVRDPKTRGSPEDLKQIELATECCMRIAISVAFLSSGHDPEVLGPDFIKKDFGAYLEALKKPEGEEQEKAVKAIQKKTDKERESASFAVGKYEHLLGRRYITHSDSDREPTEGEEGKSGRELQYCHIRNPHFRMVRYGTGRAQVRSKLIKQIIVRKDLPPKPAEVEIGFTTPKAAK